jgi:hypothetical protein
MKSLNTQEAGRKDILKERIAVEYVIPEVDSANIAKDFADQAQEHGSHEGPCLVADSQSDVENGSNTEDS